MENDNILDYIIKTCLAFLGVGIFHSVCTQLAVNSAVSRKEIASRLLAHGLIYLLLFLANEMFLLQVKGKKKQYCLMYVLSGFSGLIIWEWVINRNFHLGWMASTFFFLFWAGVVTFAKMLVDRTLEEEDRLFFWETFISFYVSMGAIAGLLYFMFRFQAAGQVFVILFYLMLNILVIMNIAHFKVKSISTIANETAITGEGEEDESGPSEDEDMGENDYRM